MRAKYFLFPIACLLLLSAFVLEPAKAATILITNSSDTLSTFRTNANTSLTNLNASLFSYPFPGSATSTAITFSGGIIGDLTGNADTVTNGVYTTTFGALFDSRLSASSSIAGIITLPNLSLPYSQLTGAPSPFSYPFPSNATSTSIAFNGGLSANSAIITSASTTNLTASGFFQLPNSAAQSPALAGACGFDTTSGQLKCGDGSGTRAMSDGYFYPAFSYSTSTAWTGTTTLPLGPAYTGETWSGVKCFTDAGTLQVSFNDGSNRMNWLQASTTVGTVTLSANNTFTASEKRYVDVGAPASGPTKIACTVKKAVTAD